MPSALDNAERLFCAGQYLDVLRDIDPRDDDLASLQPEHRVIIAHTLLQTGDFRRAVELANREIAHNPPAALRARCEVIKALVARNNAEVTKALQHYQVAVQYAKLAKDDVQLVWASVQKFRLVAEFRPSDELAPILTEIRQAAVRAGDPHAVAYMHYAVALMEASNGRTREARRHLGLTDSLLQTYPNAWLEQLNLIAAFCLDF